MSRIIIDKTQVQDQTQNPTLLSANLPYLNRGDPSEKGGTQI